MKKLNLGKLKLATEDVLQRSQLGGIYGGSGGSGTCGYRDPGGYVVCNQSQSTVMGWVAQYGGNYCCDSCGGNGGSASYC